MICSAHVRALPSFYVLALVGRKVHVPNGILIGALAAIALGLLIDRVRQKRKK